MRSELGKISLDHVFKERESLNTKIVIAINHASAAWGLSCLRYEIRDIHLPANVQEAMQLQVAAERKKRAAILESEGVRESEINIAEGKKRAQVLASEAEKIERINLAEARATALRAVSEALQSSQGAEAASLTIAEQYVAAFGNLAKQSNTLIIPNGSSDIAAAVSQAMGIFKTLSKEHTREESSPAAAPVSNGSGRKRTADSSKEGK